MPAPPHTSPVHVPVLDAPRDEDHPGPESRHPVAEDVSERTRSDGHAAARLCHPAPLRSPGRVTGAAAAG
ncbi:hypothetical protein [Streptomyces sp. NRRL S-37]|uniref:hypothetical protein n=1 Tax=Streptomyces sp. NRRL S-37 TaxID=1463903 RepID=UPI0004C8A237|nr:hypothetical protein [Streptomyces sp. NRRL S-37]